MLTTAQEGRGFNSYLPMPFRERIEIAFTNHSEKATTLYYQVDYTLQPEVPAELGYLHVAFRRENPTVQKRDFVITEGLQGPGPLPRLRGGRAGDRPRQLVRRGRGEGLQGRRHRPPHDLRHRPRGLRRLGVGHGPARRALRRRPPRAQRAGQGGRGHGHPARLRELLPLARARPDHVRARPQGHDPADRRHVLPAGPGGREGGLRRRRTRWPARAGRRDGPPALLAWGICERVDDYSCTSYVYCQEPQGVPPVDVAAAVADIERRPYEERDRMEAVAEAVEA